MLTAQPFHYIDPQWNVVAAQLSGAELVVLDGFHPSTFWAKVREHRVTYFYCLGAMPVLLMRMPPDPADRDHSVRVVQASAIPPALHAELEERWAVGWYEAFGMTETGADIRITDEDHDDFVGTGCLGGPAPRREAKIVDGKQWSAYGDRDPDPHYVVKELHAAFTAPGSLPVEIIAEELGTTSARYGFRCGHYASGHRVTVKIDRETGRSTSWSDWYRKAFAEPQA